MKVNFNRFYRIFSGLDDATMDALWDGLESIDTTYMDDPYDAKSCINDILYDIIEEHHQEMVDWYEEDCGWIDDDDIIVEYICDLLFDEDIVSL